MIPDSSARAAYFNGKYPPTLQTFSGTVMARVAAALDSRDALVAGFSAVAQDMGSTFPQEPTLTTEQVSALIDEVIDDHNAQVTRASEQALALMDCLDELQVRGLAVVFGSGHDEAEALSAVGRLATAMSASGTAPTGYCYSDATDVAEMVLVGNLPLTYGVFAETTAAASEVCGWIVEVIERAGLPVQQHDAQTQQLLIGPIRYEVPYHGHQLHHLEHLVDQ